MRISFCGRPSKADLFCRSYTEIRFKNNGLDLIEVQDNGSGISPENYENIGELCLIAPVDTGGKLLRYLLACSTETLYLQALLIRRPLQSSYLRLPR